MSVTLLEIIAAAEARRAPIVPEIAGYVVLGVADRLLASPRVVDPADILLAVDGSIRIRSGEASTPEAGEAVLRGLLAVLLDVASSGAPALARASRAGVRAGIEGFVREVEAALIPVNRAAGQRALARLVRETMRAPREALDLAAARALVEIRLGAAPTTSSCRAPQSGPPIPASPPAAASCCSEVAPQVSPCAAASPQPPSEPVAPEVSEPEPASGPPPSTREAARDPEAGDGLSEYLTVEDADLLSEAGWSPPRPAADCDARTPRPPTLTPPSIPRLTPDVALDLDEVDAALPVEPTPVCTPPVEAVTRPEGRKVRATTPTPFLGTMMARGTAGAGKFVVSEAVSAGPVEYSGADATERMPEVATVDGCLPDELPASFDVADPEVEERASDESVGSGPPESVSSSPCPSPAISVGEDPLPSLPGFEPPEASPTPSPAMIAAALQPSVSPIAALDAEWDRIDIAAAAPEPPPPDVGVADPTTGPPPVELTPSCLTPLGPSPFLRPPPLRAPFSSEAPPSVPATHSDVSDLIERFAVANDGCEREVGPALKELAGLPPTGAPPRVESTTPAPVVADRSAGVGAETEGRAVTARAIVAVVGAVGILALAVGSLDGPAGPVAEAPPAGAAASPEGACSAAVVVRGAPEGAEVRVRDLETGPLQSGSGPAVRFDGLPCGKALDVTVADPERGGWIRLPVSAEALPALPVGAPPPVLELQVR